MASVVGGDEVGERGWPAERAVDPGLVGLLDGLDDDIIVGGADDVFDDRAAVSPFDAGKRRPFRHRGQVYPGSDHRQRLSSATAAGRAHLASAACLPGEVVIASVDRLRRLGGVWTAKHPATHNQPTCDYCHYDLPYWQWLRLYAGAFGRLPPRASQGEAIRVSPVDG